MELVARRQLEEVIFPFWLNHGIDAANGGFYTCFDNRGRERLSTDKFTWSQGRFVWLLARAARLASHGLLSLDAADLVRHAERGARFLVDHAIGEDGTCAYLLDEHGNPKQGERSIFADCFVAMGLAELTRQTGSDEWIGHVDTIIQRVADDVANGDPPTPPYPLPPGVQGFGARMILLNARLDQVRAHEASHGVRAHEASHGSGGDLREALSQARQGVLAHREPDGLFTEMRDAEPGTILANHRNAGHALEGLWMALESGELLGEHDDDAALVASASALCESGWDQEFGGLSRFTEVTGRRRGGPYEDLIRNTWSTKLWWVHSEAAYTTRLAAVRYGDRSGWSDRVWRYTIDTFPGGDQGEEWIQIRDRAGRPFDEVVALPVKDPYHIARNLMQILELGAAV